MNCNDTQKQEIWRLWQRGSGVYETRSRKYYAEVKVARVGVRETRSRKYYAEVKVAHVGVGETRNLETWFAVSSLGKLAEFYSIPAFANNS